MTPSPASSGPGAPGLDIPVVTVAPGSVATTTLTVRNDGDIVEAYSLEVVGDCAAWSAVEPARVSLYPGTSETVTITLSPPRSPEIRAGERPFAVRVLPAEHPEAVRVPEGIVRIEEFHELETELVPRRRRGWLRGRYRLAVRNQGNTPVQVEFTPGQAGEDLGFAFTPERPKLEPGESAEIGLKVRTGKPVWFGSPVVWPFTLTTTEVAPAPADATEPGTQELPRTEDDTVPRAPLDAEFVQIPIFPKWLLALLALLIALVLLWFTLVRPAVRSAAKDAAKEAVQPRPAPTSGATAGQGTGGTGAAPDGGQVTPGQGNGNGQGGTGTGPGTSTGTGGGTGVGEQTSQTIEVKSNAGQTVPGIYTVPANTVFRVTDVVLANFQGDEGVLTFSFGDRKITTIALETFRNQDYHWVTPIEIPANDTVTVEVTCAKPGTPATGRRAAGCNEVLNVSGVLTRTTP
ncbi:COG1470 family protein [Streptomyces acidiscabies]|uniref:COG1470 family protein n=1 Tax=Streptomyces acidiscabies TaxID=42234 RepID=UPI001F3B4781|nr:hydrolytic protein [Streptomyces acidiscabies]